MGLYFTSTFFYVRKGNCVAIPFSVILLPLVRFSFVTRTAPTGLPPPSGTPSINRGRVLLRVRLITEKLTDSKKLLYKYLFAIDNVDTTLGYLLKLAALEVVDALDSLAVDALNAYDTSNGNLASVSTCSAVIA